ncbi:MAG TPA: FAD-binding protein [Jiangellaceae bacterium]
MTDTRTPDTTSRIGWDAGSRSWIVGDGVTTPDQVPELDGRLILGSDLLAENSRDLGRIVSARPGAVLRPGSVDDIAAMVGFCWQRGIPVAPRGEAHTTHGQGLVEGGLVIDMTVLNTIHAIDADGADVDAGVLWSDLVARAAAEGLRAVNLTGYLKLTVGGTLSVGGISPAYREGAQLDQVRKLQVVTGAGRVEWCSPEENPALFEAALGGLGQVGVITRAVVDLVARPEAVRTWRLPFVDVADAFAAMRSLIGRDELDELYCMVLPPGPDSPAVYLVHASRYYATAAPPQDDALLRDLPERVPAAAQEQFDLPYLVHVSVYDEAIERLRQGDWDRRAKPWFDVFLPDESVESYVTEVVPTLDADDWSLPDGGGFVLFFPHRRAAFGRPRLRLPDSELVWLFDILNVAPRTSGPDFVRRMLRRNHGLWDRARAVGGVRYPIGSLDFGPEDWQHHYGATFEEVTSAKRRFDPAGILTPGPRIFAPHGAPPT